MSTKAMIPRSANSGVVTGRASLNNNNNDDSATTKSANRTMEPSSSQQQHQQQQQQQDEQPLLCPANIVASRRVLFSPGVSNSKRPPASSPKKIAVPTDTVEYVSSPSSDKENSGHGKRTTRFTDISSVQLREVAKTCLFGDMDDKTENTEDDESSQGVSTVVSEITFDEFPKVNSQKSKRFADIGSVQLREVGKSPSLSRVLSNEAIENGSKHDDDNDTVTESKDEEPTKATSVQGRRSKRFTDISSVQLREVGKSPSLIRVLAHEKRVAIDSGHKQEEDTTAESNNEELIKTNSVQGKRSKRFTDMSSVQLREVAKRYSVGDTPINVRNVAGDDESGATSEESVKAKSVQGKRSKRFTDINSVQLREVSKSYSLETPTNETRNSVEGPRRMRANSVDEESIKAKSVPGKRSKRFTDINSVQLREVSKSYFLETPTNEKTLPVDSEEKPVANEEEPRKATSVQCKRSKRFTDFGSVQLRGLAKVYSLDTPTNDSEKRPGSIRSVADDEEPMKAKSVQCQKSKRFTDISSVQLRGVAKAYSLDTPTNEKSDFIDDESLSNDMEPIRPSTKFKRFNDISSVQLREVVKTYPFGEDKSATCKDDKEHDVFVEDEGPAKKSVFERRSPWLNQRVSKASSFTEPEEEPAAKPHEQQTDWLCQRVVKARSFTEPDDEPSASNEQRIDWLYRRAAKGRELDEEPVIKFSNSSSERSNQKIAKASSFTEPDEEPAKMSVFEQRSQWLHQRVVKATSFTEPEEEEVETTPLTIGNETPTNETPNNIVTTRAMWLQNQVSRNGMSGNEKSSARSETRRKTEGLPDTPTVVVAAKTCSPPRYSLPRMDHSTAPPRYSISNNNDQPVPLMEGKRKNKLLKKAKKTNTVKPKPTLVEERAKWLQTQVSRNELHQDVPSEDEEELDVEQPKSDIELRLEALQKEMTANQHHSGVAPKRSLTELP